MTERGKPKKKAIAHPRVLADEKLFKNFLLVEKLLSKNAKFWHENPHLKKILEATLKF